MSEGKIEFHIGNISFVGEGQEEWLSEQLDKVIEHFGRHEQATLDKPEFSEQQNDANIQIQDEVDNNSIYNVNLSNFIRSQGATSNQRLRFLATAAWLAKNNENNLETAEITAALKSSRQPSLSNPAHYLNENVKQGYCEKDGDHFFVTPQGFKTFENTEDQ